MTSKDKGKHKFGDWLLKQEDEAGFYSYKRIHLANLRQKYWTLKIGRHNFIILFILMGILIFSNNEIVIAISFISFMCILTLILIAVIIYNTCESKEIEEYVRAEFDKMYGKGKYDKVMKKIKVEKSVFKRF